MVRKIAPLITTDELVIVKMHWILGLLLDVFERDKTVISQSGIKTPQPYIDMIDRAMDAVAVEIKTIRQQMRLSGLKTFNEKRDADGFSFEYVCRGYANQFRILNGYLASSVEIEKRRFLGEDVSKYIHAEVRLVKPTEPVELV